MGWICLKVYSDRISAELALGILEANSVNAFISSDDCGGMRPELSFINGSRLMVDEANKAQALELLSMQEDCESI